MSQGTGGTIVSLVPRVIKSHGLGTYFSKGNFSKIFYIKIRLFTFRSFHGLFSTPEYVFPRKCAPATPTDLGKYTPMLQPGDQLSDVVVIRGSTYRVGFIVITQVFSADVLQVGEILKIVVRNNCVFFLVILSEAARNQLGFFESLPSDTVALASYKSLGDFKPLIKRAGNVCYPFVLHHHVVL